MTCVLHAPVIFCAKKILETQCVFKINIAFFIHSLYIIKYE